ncbi:glycosyltransferase family 2 protein [Seonamhaeicola sp.]|uniref:glycosyltransferase family 2 protein n=1 Tax=Seonamhaeicola sp. TaxID=1912245 RepID=UPI0026272384|nr:glycosyltransferase family 2 protein [Seonamhaeicola sp.]
MNPLISIIIPTYNRASFIGKTLDSILAQTYKNWECIIVDDGSTDNTAKVVATYCDKDDRFQYHSRPDNRTKGANACRNYGFELSKGDYINWFDSDDIMMPQKLELQINGLHNSNFDFSICQTLIFDVVKNKEKGLRAPKLKSDNIFEDYITYNIFWLTGAPVWKKAFLKKYDLNFDEELQQAQDYDFHMRALYVSENYIENETPLVQFNIHEDNMSKTIYDDPQKTFSNIKVKYNILKKYGATLSKDVKKNTLEELTKLYSYVIRERHKKISYKTCKFILSLYKENKALFSLNKFKTSVYAMVPLFYVYLGKGFKLTKLANQIISK